MARERLTWNRDGSDGWTADGRAKWRIEEHSSSSYLVETGETAVNHYVTLRLRGRGWGDGGGSCSTVEEAKALADEIERNAELRLVTPADRSESIVFLIAEEDCEPIMPQPEIPDEIRGPCPECNSRIAPVFSKPLQNSGTWWDDPAGWWICPQCHKHLLCPNDVAMKRRLERYSE